MSTKAPKPPKRAIFAYKPSTLLDAAFGGRPLELNVATTIRMTDAQYAEFISDFTLDRDWIKAFNALRIGRIAGRTTVIEITCPGEKTLYIDPEGSSYARNVGIEW